MEHCLYRIAKLALEAMADMTDERMIKKHVFDNCLARIQQELDEAPFIPVK